MAIDLTPEQREIGKQNFQRIVGHHYEVNRRQFLGGVLAASAAIPLGAAAYYGYKKLEGSPIKAGLIGAGDEGGVLVGEHNPDYMEFIAVSDIRPSCVRGIFDGAPPTALRKGFNRIYGTKAGNIKRHVDYRDMLKDKDIQAIVIALPLHLHAKVTIEALNAGKHVLCEKLMAWNVQECKEMIRAAQKNDRVLSIGHQRHYSMMYAHAQEVLKAGEIGDIRHIRAFWHRNNATPILDEKGNPKSIELTDVNTGKPYNPARMVTQYRDSWWKAIPDEDRKALEADIRKFGYRSMEELLRWRVYRRTGGGLMAELGSHQLDACSIFLGKVKPLAVSATGGKFFYKDDREADDHVYCTYEFPGKNYWEDYSKGVVKDKNDIIVVTYSSISTNSYEPYGECVMGTAGTMIVEKEESVMLYGSGGRATAMAASVLPAGKPAADSSSTWGPSEAKGKQDLGAKALGDGPVSKGYKEEMEHFAFCVKMWEDKSVKKEERPNVRCHGTVAMADAIIALTTNQAIRKQQRIEFKKEWFDPGTSAVPDEDMKVVDLDGKEVGGAVS